MTAKSSGLCARIQRFGFVILIAVTLFWITKLFGRSSSNEIERATTIAEWALIVTAFVEVQKCNGPALVGIGLAFLTVEALAARSTHERSEELFKVVLPADAAVSLSGSYAVALVDPEVKPALILPGIGRVSDTQCAADGECKATLHFNAGARQKTAKTTRAPST